MAKVWRVFEYLLFVEVLFAFAFRTSLQLEMAVSYELIEDIRQPLEKEFGEKHLIVRRAAPHDSNSSIPGLILPSSSITHMLFVTDSKSVPEMASPHVSSAVMANASPSISIATASVSPSVSNPGIVKTSVPLWSTTNPVTTSSRTTNTPSEPTTESTSYSQDEHTYYTSRHYPKSQRWWFSLDGEKSYKVLEKLVETNTFTSNNLKISFKFPFYGHIIQNVTITNKGYVFLGERLHKFNASAQYVAPLMANFGPELNRDTKIHYVDTGDRFTVEWTNMKLINKPDGEFSFQCSILKNGTLIFAYKNIPTPVVDLIPGKLPVRVGLSDTYRRDKIVHRPFKKDGRTYSGVHYIYYYLYHKIQLNKKKIASNSAFVIVPEPNCVTFDSCETCVRSTTKFDCRWCAKLSRCSDGIDRHRQEWDNAGCLESSVAQCSKKSGGSGRIGPAEIALIVLIPMLLVLVLVSWCVYAYRHPQSKSGMCLIEHGNPLKWCRNSSGTQSGTTGGRITFKTMTFENKA